MKTILHIVGNRPQFIKLAVLYQELAAAGIPQRIVHTGQHASQEMSTVFFHELGIPAPDIQLQLEPAAFPDQFVGAASAGLQQYFSTINGGVAFAYGDTNTTAAAALAAARTRTMFIHFEAGIRTGDNSMPEEINRIIADRFADINYCCTDNNFRTMQSEGYGGDIGSRLVLTGDLMYDAFLKIAADESYRRPEKEYVVCTIHRAGNILSRENLAAIVDGLNAIHLEMPVIMPVHPHTKKRLEEYGLVPIFHQVDPLGYAGMKSLLQGSSFVITDSGGAAREAFFCHKPSVVVMEKPFWPEITGAGCSVSTAADSVLLQEAFRELPRLSANFQSPIFGKGNAAQLIKEDLLSCLA